MEIWGQLETIQLQHYPSFRILRSAQETWGVLLSLKLQLLCSHIHADVSRNIMTTSMNERSHFFIKIYLSHFIRKCWCWLCVRGELERETDYYILTQSSFRDHSSTSSSSWLGCYPWVLRAQALCLELVLTPESYLILELQLELQLTQTFCGTWLYNCITSPASVGVHICTEFNHVHRSRWYSNILDRMNLFLPLIYKGASLDWRLGRGPIYNTVRSVINLQGMK